MPDEVEVFRAATDSEQLMAIASLNYVLENERTWLSWFEHNPLTYLAIVIAMVALFASSVISLWDLAVMVVLLGVIFLLTGRIAHRKRRRLAETAARLAVYERVYDSTRG